MGTDARPQWGRYRGTAAFTVYCQECGQFLGLALGEVSVNYVCSGCLRRSLPVSEWPRRGPAELKAAAG